MNFFAQSFRIPEPPITEKNCPDQNGRVYLITGGYAGVGYELSRILYSRNAAVYVAGRSQDKAEAAIATIKNTCPASSGRIAFLSLDLADLTTIKPAVKTFLAKEQRLDVLINNAGVMDPPTKTTPQNHDTLVATHILSPYLLYLLLSPILTNTASTSPSASVRVLWAGSIGIDIASPKPHGIRLLPTGAIDSSSINGTANYAQTKVAAYFMTKHLARNHTPKNGIVHVCFNPGNLKTELQRNWGRLARWITEVILLHPAVYGAYTELWAAVALEITRERSGCYVWPWGKLGGVRRDVEDAAQSQEQGGLADKMVRWVDKEVQAYK